MKSKAIILLTLLFTSCLASAAPTPSEVNAVLTKYANNPKGWSALNYAIELKDFEAAIILIDYVRDFSRTDDRFNALNRVFKNALNSGQYELTSLQIELLKKLIQKGIDVRGDPATNYSPLLVLHVLA